MAHERQHGSGGRHRQHQSANQPERGADWRELTTYEEALGVLDATVESLRDVNAQIQDAHSRGAWVDPELDRQRKILAGQVHALQRRVARLRPKEGSVDPELRLAKAFMDEAANTLSSEVFDRLKAHAEEVVANE